MPDKSKVKKVIQLFESLKAERKTITIENALGFGTKVMQLIRNFIGKESEQYTMMHSVIINQAGPNSMGNYFSADEFIELRLKIHDHQFDSIIDSCIESIKTHGLYKPPSDRKNILGDLDNSMIWTLFSLVAFGAFSFGIAFNNWQLNKYLEPSAKRENDPKEVQSQTLIDTHKVEVAKKNHSTLKHTAK